MLPEIDGWTVIQWSVIGRVKYVIDLISGFWKTELIKNTPNSTGSNSALFTIVDRLYCRKPPGCFGRENVYLFLNTYIQSATREQTLFEISSALLFHEEKKCTNIERYIVAWCFKIFFTGHDGDDNRFHGYEFEVSPRGWRTHSV